MSDCVRMSDSKRLLRAFESGFWPRSMPHQETAVFEIGQISPGLPICDPVTKAFDVLWNANLLSGLYYGEEFLLPVVQVDRRCSGFCLEQR